VFGIIVAFAILVKKIFLKKIFLVMVFKNMFLIKTTIRKIFACKINKK